MTWTFQLSRNLIRGAYDVAPANYPPGEYLVSLDGASNLFYANWLFIVPLYVSSLNGQALSVGIPSIRIWTTRHRFTIAPLPPGAVVARLGFYCPQQKDHPHDNFTLWRWIPP